MLGPQSSLLASAPGDPPRLHLHHGPIDLVIQAWGRGTGDVSKAAKDAQVLQAYRAATRHFEPLLQQLVDELGLLRRPVYTGDVFMHRVRGPVARRMVNAVAPLAARCFVTPMAAVAGAVADEIVSVMWCQADLSRAFVNNGGDIALRLRPGQQLTAGIVANPDGMSGRAGVDGGNEPANETDTDGYITLRHEDGISGMATSGWRGRSHSLGIADAVTVVAQNAAGADVAATLLANAVNLPGDNRIGREPAASLAPDSDLGDRLVTTSVPALDRSSIEQALLSGQRLANSMLGRGQIIAALLSCQGYMRIVGSSDSPLGRGLVHHNMEAYTRVICS